MRVFFQQHGGALHAPLDDLDHAAHGGHKLAAYMLAMILWRANSGTEADVRAKQLLAEVAHYDQALAVCSNRGVSRPSVHAYDMLWMYVWPDFHQSAPVPGPMPRADVHKCTSPRWGWVPSWCGVPASHEGWLEWSYFCSEECRIRSLCDDAFHWLGVDN